MKTKKSKAVEIGEENFAASSATPAPSPATAPAIESEKINRISIPLTKDGQIEWDSMREKTREKVKQLIGTPSTENKGGSVQVFSPEMTGAIYDTIGKLESFAAVKLYKFSPEIADVAFTYSEMEKEKLAGPTARVINKYAPTWLEKYQDEVALAMLFVTMTAVKFQMASALMAQKTAMEKASAQSEPKSKAVINLPSERDLDIVMAEREMAKN